MKEDIQYIIIGLLAGIVANTSHSAPMALCHYMLATGAYCIALIILVRDRKE